MKKKIILMGIIIILIIGIGGIIYVNQKNENEASKDREVEAAIAEEFSSRYLAPDGAEVSEVTFYKGPVDQSDFSGNRNYFFYFNQNENWTVGASIKKNTNEVWAFGSNEIELNHKENEETVEGLTIHYWGE